MVASHCVRDIRVVYENIQLEALRPFCNLGPDLSEADDAKCLSVELGSHETLALPFPLLHEKVGLRNLPEERQDESQCVLRRADAVSLRSVHHNDAPSRCGSDVDVVHACSRA